MLLRVHSSENQQNSDSGSDSGGSIQYARLWTTHMDHY